MAADRYRQILLKQIVKPAETQCIEAKGAFMEFIFRPIAIPAVGCHHFSKLKRKLNGCCRRGAHRVMRRMSAHAKSTEKPDGSPVADMLAPNCKRSR